MVYKNFISICVLSLALCSHANADIFGKIKDGVKELEKEIIKIDENPQKQEQKKSEQKNNTRKNNEQEKSEQKQSNSSKNLTIKTTNFVNKNHENAVKSFNNNRSYIKENMEKLKSLGGLSGKQIYCSYKNKQVSRKYGMVFIGNMGEGTVLLYRFQEPSDGYSPLIANTNLGAEYVIMPGVMIRTHNFEKSFWVKNAVTVGSVYHINRETLDLYETMTNREVKRGKCEIFKDDLYLKFKKLSDDNIKAKKERIKKQEEKNKS